VSISGDTLFVKTLSIFMVIVASAIIGHSQPVDDYTVSTLHWTPLSELTPTSTEVGFSQFPFTAGKLSQFEGYTIRVGGSAIPNGLLAPAPSRLVYDVPAKGFIVLRGKVALRDGEKCDQFKVSWGREGSVGEQHHEK
jgi:hypothetical protein